MILRYHRKPSAFPQPEVILASQHTLKCIRLIHCRIAICVLVVLLINHFPDPVHVKFVGLGHEVDHEPAFP